MPSINPPAARPGPTPPAGGPSCATAVPARAHRCAAAPGSARKPGSVRLLLALHSLALLAACDAVAPPLPDNAVLFTPPPVYSRWWRMVEECSARGGALTGVDWYQVPGVSEVEVNGRMAAGYWSKAGNRIVLAGKHVYDGAIVRHEMLHALVRGRGHPREYFLGTCAAVVTCSSECVEGSFTPPAPSVPLFARDLDVDVDITPAHPTEAVDDGFFAVVVKVRNPASSAVTIVAPDGQATLRAFGYQLRSPWSVMVASRPVNDASTVWFGPGEVKRYVFDFHIRKADRLSGLPVGRYDVVGTFDRASSPLVAITIGQ